MIPGPKVTIGGKEYVMPPLPWHGLKKHKAFLSRMMRAAKASDVDQEKFFDEDLGEMFDCVYLALKRNYPELTEELLAEHVDMRNLPEYFNAMMGAVGFTEKPAGE